MKTPNLLHSANCGHSKHLLFSGEKQKQAACSLRGEYSWPVGFLSPYQVLAAAANTSQGFYLYDTLTPR